MEWATAYRIISLVFIMYLNSNFCEWVQSGGITEVFFFQIKKKPQGAFNVLDIYDNWIRSNFEPTFFFASLILFPNFKVPNYKFQNKTNKKRKHWNQACVK